MPRPLPTPESLLPDGAAVAPDSAPITGTPSRAAGLLIAASVSIFGYGMIAPLAGTLVPSITRELHISNAAIADLFFAQAMGMIAASLLAGLLVDKAGGRLGMVASVALLCAALFSLPHVDSFHYLLACMALLGLGGGCLTTAASACISAAAPARRAATLSLTKCSYGLGGFATPWIGATALAGNTFALCLWIGVLMLSIGLVFLIIPVQGPAQTNRFRISDAAVLFKAPLLRLLCLLLFLYVACEVGIFNWLPKYLILTGMPDSSALKTVSAGFALGLVVGRLAFAGVLLKFSARRVLLGGSVAMLVFTFTLLQLHGEFLTLGAVFCSGLAMAPIFPAVVALVGDHFPSMTASAMGAVITSGWVGLALSSRLIGVVSSHFAGGLEAGLYVIPCLTVPMIATSLMIFRHLSARRRVNGAS